jgi:hypothetical protein
MSSRIPASIASATSRPVSSHGPAAAWSARASSTYRCAARTIGRENRSMSLAFCAASSIGATYCAKALASWAAFSSHTGTSYSFVVHKSSYLQEMAWLDADGLGVSSGRGMFVVQDGATD